MKTAGIVAEYNPLHAGHEYHIQKTRELTGADLIIVCMSGSYCERGIPAFFDKFSRTKAALSAGADLVVELPLTVSTGSAEIFAQGAVNILNAMHVDVLSFGSECGDISSLCSLASLLSNESAAFKSVLKEKLGSGLSYPAALSAALKQSYPDEAEKFTGLLDSPNNTLGIEYIKAAKAINSGMEFFTLKRQGMGYNEGDPDYKEILKNKSLDRNPGHADPDNLQDNFDICHNSPLQFTSSSALRASLAKDSGQKYLVNDDFSDILAAKLFEGSFLQSIADVTPELADRITNNLAAPFTFSELADRLKTKNYTHARINRCLWHIIHGITKEDYAKVKSGSFPGYIRILGMNEKAGKYIKALKAEKQNERPLFITRPAQDIKLLDHENQALYSRDITAYRLYRQVFYKKYGIVLPDEYSGMVVNTIS